MNLLERTHREARARIETVRPTWRAVVDIGSNSVRLVIFQIWRASLIQHYNEKVLSGLGRGLNESGRLNPAGVESACAALRRFKAIAEGIGEVPVDVFATAAVRTATNGTEFVMRIKAETGFSVNVLSGFQEGEGSSRGVLAGMREVRGVIGDLGGSSLELIVAGESLSPGETHMLGPLAFPPADAFPATAVRERARAALEASPALIAAKEAGSGLGRTFYAVGGSWRALALLHMRATGYPLELLQGYRMKERDVSRLTRRLSDPRDSIQPLAGEVADKRLSLLPYAAVVLDEVLRVGGFETVVISAYGLREGRVLAAERITGDPRAALLDGLEAICRLEPRQLAFCEALLGFVEPVTHTLPPVFGSAETDALMVHAATRISDVGTALHPDYRPDLAYQLVLHGPYAGVDHTERAFLALCAGVRYSRAFKPPEKDVALLSAAQSQRARVIGALMRLGAVHSGRSAEVLRRASLGLEPGFLVLRAGDSHRDMVSELVVRRLEQAAGLLGLQALIG